MFPWKQEDSLKFYCDIEGLEENWVEVDERWTREETRRLNSAGEEETLALFHSKVKKCSLTSEDGVTVTDPKAVTADFLDTVRVELIGFIGAVLPRAVRQLQALGNAAVRLSSDSNGRQTAPKSQTS